MGGFDISSIKNAALRVFAESIDTDENNGGKIRGKLEERELSIFLAQGESRLKDNKTALAEFREIFNQLKDGWNHFISQDETNRTPYGEMSNVESYAEEGYRFTSTQELEDGTQTIRYDKEDGSYMVETLGSNKKEYYNDKGQLIKSCHGCYVEERTYEGNTMTIQKTYKGDLYAKETVTTYNDRTVTIYEDYMDGHLASRDEETQYYFEENGTKQKGNSTYVQYSYDDKGHKHIIRKGTYRPSGVTEYEVKYIKDSISGRKYTEIIDAVEDSYTWHIHIENDNITCEIVPWKTFSEGPQISKEEYILNNPDIPKTIKEKIRSGEIKLENSETEEYIYNHWQSQN